MLRCEMERRVLCKLLVLPMLLLAFIGGLDASEAPGPVENLTAYQEGFNGLVSLRWDFSNDLLACNYYFNISVTDDSDTLVKFKKPSKEIQDCVTSIEVLNPTARATYNLTVTPIVVDDDGSCLPGPPRTTAVTLLPEDEAASPPADFRWKSDDDLSLATWTWTDNGVTENDTHWFFVRACPRPDVFDCRNLILTDTHVLKTWLVIAETFNVQIFAHVQSSQNLVPTRSSNPLEAAVETVKDDWPKPEHGAANPLGEMPRLDGTTYAVTWTILPSNFLEVTTAVLYKNGEPNGLPLATKDLVSNCHVNRRLEVTLDYNTNYTIKCYATYRQMNDETEDVEGAEFTITSIQGPSNPVRNLRANQVGFGGRVDLTWDPPRKTNGPIAHYVVRAATGSDTQPEKQLNSESTSVTVIVEKAKFGSVYDFSVTPVNEQDGHHAIVGQASIFTITLEQRSGLPKWAIVLIVVVVLALVIGVAYYVRARRNNGRSQLY